MNEYFIVNIAIILVSGFIAGTICKYLKASPLIGYLLVGALIGPGCLDLTNVREYERTLESVEQSVVLEEKTRQNSEEALEKRSHNRAEAISNRFERPSTLAQENVELRRELATVERELAEQRGRTTRPADSVDNENAEQLARMREGRYALESATEFGVLLLLFSIGIEFTFAQLAATAKYMFVGGAIQMGLTIGVGILVCILFKMNWIAGLAIGSVLALSSTALVYKSLGDLGQADTKRAQATLGLLIFQDIALVPLLLILPIVLGIVINSFFEETVQKIVKLLPLVSVVAIVLIVGGVVAVSSQRILETGLLIMLVVMLHNLLGYSIGFLIAKALHMNVAKAKAISIEVGMQNSGLATSLAMLHFGAAAAIPGAIFSVWHNISGSLAANYLSSHMNKEPETPTYETANAGR